MNTDLNPQQKQAVETLHGPLIILAGAGSGKTRILTRRIVHLIESGTAFPGEIIAVTFTNKAAKEMRERVEKMLSSHGIPNNDLWITTFHSAGARILREYGTRIGLQHGFSIFDDSDQLACIKNCMDRLEISDKLLSPKTIQYKINALKNDGIDPRNYEPKSIHFLDQKMLPVLKLYEETLKSSNAVDFGDLLFKTYKIFAENPDILDRFQDRYRYLLVDEYQDTNPIQYLWLKLMSQRHKNICVVGDEDQSIYKWRGADIRNILEFEKDFPETAVIKLEQNYRSSAHIIRAASKVISNNTQRKDKKLFTENADGEQVEVHIVENDFEEARWLVKKVRELIDSGTSLTEIAIFYRTHSQSRLLEDSLRYERINYKIFGGLKFYDRAEVKDALAYLRVLANPRDDISLYRIINVPTRKIGKTTIDALKNYASKESLSGLEAAAMAARGEGPELGSAAKKSLKAFVDLYAELQGRMNEFSVQDFYSWMLEKTGYLKSLEMEDSIEAAARLENLKELATAIRDYEDRAEEPSITHFLQEVALVTDNTLKEENSPFVTMMTLHSAKGLEYNYVFLVGCEEGLFPSIPQTQMAVDPEAIEEERRLCYVGMTRARKKLWMSSARQRRVFGITQIREPSRFLDELPRDEVVFQDHAPSRPRPFFSAPSKKKWGDDDFNQDSGSDPFSDFGDFEDKRPKAKVYPFENSLSQSSPDEWNVGVKVRHPDYGDGIIVQREGSMAALKVSVRFTKVGTKKFVAKFAPLQIL